MKPTRLDRFMESWGFISAGLILTGALLIAKSGVLQ